MLHATTANPQSAEAALDLQRNAYNAAFYELGLRWHWDERTYRSLSQLPEEGQRIKHYLESEQSHLLSAYDAGFLVDAIQSTKARCFELLARNAANDPTAKPVNWAEFHCSQVGV